MKRVLFFFLLILFGYTYSFAQQESKTISFEPFVGLSISNLTDADLDSKVGITAGVNLQYQCSEKFGLVTGLGFSNYGAKDGNSSLTLGYVELPFLAKYYIYKGLALSTGGQIGLNVVDGRTQFILFSEANKCSFGVPLEVSYDFKRAKISARYHIGLTNVYKDFDFKNRSLKITFGYKI